MILTGNHTENVKTVLLYPETVSRLARCYLQPVHLNTRTSHDYSKSPLGPSIMRRYVFQDSLDLG
jgi:hypothetical protein